MKKLILILIVGITFLLTGCSQEPIVCGEGTVIKDGQCVAADIEDDEPSNNDVTCDDISGTPFYSADFTALEGSLVDNEVGREHTQNNFVIWGKNETGQLLDDVTVTNGILSVPTLDGSQFDSYYDTGLGYQFFDFETDVTYSVCTIVEGPSGQSLKSELGIYYGHGQRDDVLLTGEKQLIIQDYKPTLSTNTDYGQYVIFTGNINGELKIHEITIVSNN